MILQESAIELATFQPHHQRGAEPTMARKVAKNNTLMQGLWTETIWPRPCRDAKALVRTVRQPPIRVPPASVWHNSTTQNGTNNSLPRSPCEENSNETQLWG